ncbi:MAG TPA: hypothetical protein VMM58_01055 [Bacteroidota bacterium]|nr:hypothetical protein [Bacteroidota bacterium]
MIEEFIDSALIIDDSAGEIQELKNLLESHDIWVKHYRPMDLGETKLRNRKIVFLDLSLDDLKTPVDNISTIIRPMLLKNFGRNFGTYGVVLWTKHFEDVSEFKKRVQKDAGEYSLPLFVVALDKTKYSGRGDYSSVFDDLNEQLKQNASSSFFIEWFSLINRARDKSIDGVYSLVNDYELQSKDLQFILFQLAKNYTGIPFEQIKDYSLHVDTFKAFNDILSYEVSANVKTKMDIFDHPEKVSYLGIGVDLRSYEYLAKDDGRTILNNGLALTANQKKEDPHKNRIVALQKEVFDIYSSLNGKLLIDEYHLDQQVIIPGNIYEILDRNSMFRLPTLPDNSTPIIVEVTPPCDFAQKQILHARVLGGYMTEVVIDDIPKKGYYYKDAFPIRLSTKDKSQILVFDFRFNGFLEEGDLKDNSKYKLLFRAKDKFFADILQKLSGHSARLGLPVIH